MSTSKVANRISYLLSQILYILFGFIGYLSWDLPKVGSARAQSVCSELRPKHMDVWSCSGCSMHLCCWINGLV